MGKGRCDSCGMSRNRKREKVRVLKASVFFLSKLACFMRLPFWFFLHPIRTPFFMSDKIPQTAFISTNFINYFWFFLRLPLYLCLVQFLYSPLISIQTRFVLILVWLLLCILLACALEKSIGNDLLLSNEDENIFSIVIHKLSLWHLKNFIPQEFAFLFIGLLRGNVL